jgi:signal transduction histidine kinase
MRSEGIALSLALSTPKQFIGFLVLGEKSSGDVYFDQDIRTLRIVGPELSVALQNAQRFEEISLFNVTLQEEVKRATHNLRIANDHLKELDKLKDEFISMASHELRTPANSTRNFLWQVLNKLKPGKAIKEQLEKAYNANERTITLVNDTLDVSKIEANRVTMTPEKFDLNKLLTEVEEEMQPRVKEKKLKFNLKSSGKIPVNADAQRIRQVINNLITNAIKFTPEKGSVTVESSVDKKEARVSVTDTGIGISKENIAKLFVKFGRLDTSLSSIPSTPGTGLGLFISKSLVELSGGKIWAESKVGEGSTFSFTLPLYKE